jgi:hypothetical protein
MAYDAQPGVQGVLLFGGMTAAGPANDTWLFNGTSWSLLSLEGGPPPLFEAAMASWGSNGTILFGGCEVSNCSAQSDATWSFQTNASCVHGYAGSCWVRVAPHAGYSPPGLAGASMAVDPIAGPLDGTVVIYGGLNRTCASCAEVYSNSTWLFDGFRWVNSTSTYFGSPYPNAPRAFSTLVWDPISEWLYLYGGLSPDGSPVVSRTWTTNVDSWANESELAAPNGTSGLASTGGYLSGGGHIYPALAFGGNTSAPGPANDTSVFETSVVSEVHVSPTAAETNATVNFYSNSSGGSRPTARWEFGDGTSALGGNATHAYGIEGTYLSQLVVNDSWGVRLNTPVSVDVAPFAVRVGSPAVADEESPANFSVNATGGAAPYNFSWEFSDGGVASGAAVSHTFAVEGAAWARVVVRDSTGTEVESTANLVVDSALSGTYFALPTSVDVGAGTNLTGYGLGGTAPYSFEWTLPNGRTATGRIVSYVPTAVGLDNFGLAVTDSAHATWKDTIPISVNPALTFVASSSATNFFTGRTVSFSAAVHGGTPPFHYTWSFGDGSSSNGSSPRHAYASSGTFLVNVWINDSGGGHYHQLITAKVVRTSGGILWELADLPRWEVVAILVVAVSVIASLAFLWRRRAALERRARERSMHRDPPVAP